MTDQKDEQTCERYQKSLCAFKLVTGLIAFWLAWDCNRYMNIIIRITVSVLAMIFSEFYILFYAFYRTLMGNRCYVSLGEATMSLNGIQNVMMTVA